MARKHIEQIPFNIVYEPYTLERVNEFLTDSITPNITIGTNKGEYFYNISASFDIETTSFYNDGYTFDYSEKIEKMNAIPDYNPEKCAIMYIWQFGINGRVIYGRTWNEFFDFCITLIDYLNVDLKHRLIIYIHNMGFEFQFIRKLFDWYKVFSTEERTPVYAITIQGLEFRCSYMLSGYSLDNLGKNLLKYPVRKLVGNLDYSLLRNALTPLSPEELQYCINDVLVVMAYIQELIEQYGSILKLPLTNTGFVREFCRNNTIYLPNTHKRNYGYYDLIHNLNITDSKEFATLQRAYSGGFTHCNAKYNGVVVNDVMSFDFTSSYPYVMLSEKYPMSSANIVKITSKAQFEEIVNSDIFLSVFDIKFNGIYTKQATENYISVSKCLEVKNVVSNNGRLVCADSAITTITNIDFTVIEKCYTWDSMQVDTMYVYRANYLPIPFLKCVLSLYKDKTELKGVKGREVDYQRAKGMLNSCYGMTVTSPLRPEYSYGVDNEWRTIPPDDPDGVIFKNNDNKRRFLFYPWGIFVTAYARRNLFTGILSVGDDYLYSDTDSLKLKNADKHEAYFDGYNALVLKKLHKTADKCGLDFADFAPKNNKGEVKQLGVWDIDNVYGSFKTLGAKRYMFSRDNAYGEYPISITVAGVNKSVAIPYIWEKSNHNIDRCFDMFQDGLFIPPNETGKNIHTYIDEERTGVIVDYKGNSCEYDELSAVHLEATSYKLSTARDYANYIKHVQTIIE